VTLAPTLSADVRKALAQDFRTGAPAQRELGGRDNPLYPGATEIIARYAGRDDVVLGVATGKSRRGVERLFDQYDWHRHFQTIQTADTNRSKPDPEMITTAMTDVGVDPAHTIMIGDTSFDMAMAISARVHAIGVTWGYHPPHALSAAGAPTIVQSFADLADAIDRLRA
jgi:phosphoglycolate phosphatase